MRATDRLRHLEDQDKRHAWLCVVRDVAAWCVLAVHLLLGLLLVDLLFCTDVSDVDDSMIAPVLGTMTLIGFVLVGFVISGARPLPVASATIPPLLLFSLPWRDIHYAAIPATGWLVVHVGVLLWPIVHRSTPRSSRRTTTNTTARPSPSYATHRRA